MTVPNPLSVFRLLNKHTDQQLVDQYYVTLNATFEHLKLAHVESGAEVQQTLNAVDELLRTERNWRRAYEAEQWMTPLFCAEWLDMELSRRLLEAKKHLPEEYHQFYAKKQENYSEAGKQALLARLVNDLQWHYEVAQAHTLFGGICRIRTGIVFALSFIMFFLPFIMPEIAAGLNVRVGEKSYYILTALSAGWMGAAFSMLLRLRSTIDKSDLDNLKVISRYSTLFARVIIGMGAALIFYYFMESGLLAGTFLPSFPEMSYPPMSEMVCNTETIKSVKFMLMEEKSLALLIIWSFLAGFSEQMVPNVLSKTAKQAQEAGRNIR